VAEITQKYHSADLTRRRRFQWLTLKDEFLKGICQG